MATILAHIDIQPGNNTYEIQGLHDIDPPGASLDTHFITTGSAFAAFGSKR